MQTIANVDEKSTQADKKRPRDKAVVMQSIPTSDLVNAALMVCCEHGVNIVLSNQLGDIVLAL
jgi:hypothetical protein